MVELGAGEAAAERQQLAALDGDEQETVEEPVGELGRVEVAQQLVFGDVRDDPDVRGARPQRRVADQRLQAFAVPAVADDRREGVPLAREDFHHLRELRLEDEQPFVGGCGGVVVIERVADLGDQPFAAGEPGHQPAAGEVRLRGLRRCSTWSQLEPLRPFPEAPTSTQNSLG